MPAFVPALNGLAEYNAAPPATQGKRALEWRFPVTAGFFARGAHAPLQICNLIPQIIPQMIT
jgi:hypothetical protein